MYNSLFLVGGNYFPFYCNGTHIFTPCNDMGFCKSANKEELIKALGWFITDVEEGYNSIVEDLYNNHPLTSGKQNKNLLYQMYFGINFPMNNDGQ